MANNKGTVSFADAPLDVPVITSGSVKMYMDDNERPLGPQRADQKADQFDYSLGADSPGVPQLRESMLLGGETAVRNSIARNQEIRDYQKKVDELSSRLSEYRAKRTEPNTPTPEEVQHVESVAQRQPVDPNTVVEDSFGKVAMARILMGEKNDIHNEVQLIDDKTYYEEVLKGSSKLAHQMIAQKVAEEYQKKYEGESILGTVGDVLKQVIPFYNWVKVNNALPGGSSFFTGDNLDEQTRNWYSDSDLTRSEQSLRAAVDEMYRSNPTLAMSFLHSISAPSAYDRDLGNLRTVSDLTSPFFLAPKTTAKFAELGVNGVRAAVSQTTKALAPGFSRATLADAAAESDALLRTTITVAQNRAIAGVPQSMNDLVAETPTIFNPEQVTGGMYNALSRENAIRLYDFLARNGKELLQHLLIDPKFIDRLSNSYAFDEALTAARETFIKQYPTLEDRIIDQIPFVGYENNANVSGVRILFGDAEASPFATKAAAEAAVRDYGLEGAQYGRLGAGWGVYVQKPFNELLPIVRQNLSVGTRYTDPNTLQTAFFAGLRSNEYLLSDQILQDMHIAQHGASSAIETLRAVSKAIGGLPVIRKESRQYLEKFLNAQRVAKNRLDPSKVGRVSHNLGEFENDWLDMFGRLPKQNETESYFAWRQVTDMDYILRNLGAFRDQWRQGIEVHNFKFTLPDTANPLSKLKVRIKGIEGIHLPEGLPSWVWDKDNYLNNSRILVLDKDPATKFQIGGMRHASRTFATRYTDQGAFEEAFKPGDGWHFIHLNEAGDQALKSFGEIIEGLPDKRVHFLAVRGEHGSGPLPLKRIPHSEGGHNLYPETGSYLKQAHVEQLGKKNIYHMYYGDKTIMFHNFHKDAVRWAPKFDEARRLYAAWKADTGTEQALRSYIAQNLPVDYVNDIKKFDAMFEGPLGLNPDTPIQAVRAGDTTYNAYKLKDAYHNLYKFSDSPNNLNRGRDLEFMMEKDHPLLTIRESGNTVQPAAHLVRAPLVDPISTMNRSAAHLVRGRYLDDLKMKVAEKFINDYADLMELPLDQLRRNPVKYALNPPWANVVEDRLRFASARNANTAVKTFLHIKDDAAKDLSWLEQKLIQRVYGEDKPRPISRWALSVVKDPATFFRHLAFDSKLGFFNPTQYFKQLNAVVHIGGIEGWPATFNGGVVGFWLMRPLLMFNDNPEMMRQAAGFATKWGWKAQDFVDAFEYLRGSGWAVVSGDVYGLDNFAEMPVVTSALGRFRSAGRMFFKEGDRQPRIIAFATAFKKWRDANPKARFNDAIGAQLIQRADMTTSNMTAASLSRIQRGWPGVALQFGTYPMRMAEQFIGKKLSPSEKFHLWGSYGAIYGFPIATAGVVGVWPVAETFKRELDAYNVNLDEHPIGKFLTDGMLKSILTGITGTEYNINDIYGPSGLTIFHDIINGDKSASEIALGASGSIIHDAWFAIDPFLHLLINYSDASGQRFHFDGQFVANFLKGISTFNNYARMRAAMNWGVYLDRNGVIVDKVSKLDGLMMGFLGATPERIPEAFRRRANARDEADFKKRIGDQASRELAAATQSFSDNNYEEGIAHMENYNAWLVTGGFSINEISGVVKKTFKNNTMNTMADRVWRDFIRKAQTPEEIKRWTDVMNRRKRELGNAE